jgi:hypothetical protein
VSSHLLSKNLKIKIYKAIILLVLYGCETWSFTAREENILRVYGNRTPRRIFGFKREKWREAGKDCIMGSFITCMPR